MNLKSRDSAAAPLSIGTNFSYADVFTSYLVQMTNFSVNNRALGIWEGKMKHAIKYPYLFKHDVAKLQPQRSSPFHTMKHLGISQSLPGNVVTCLALSYQRTRQWILWIFKGSPLDLSTLKVFYRSAHACVWIWCLFAIQTISLWKDWPHVIWVNLEICLVCPNTVVFTRLGCISMAVGKRQWRFQIGSTPQHSFWPERLIS